MNQPAVFISCVSPEFRRTRQRIATILTRLGYTPIVQEIFGTEAGDLRQVLGDKIDGCDGLIQIVGHAYGTEPPTVEVDYGRVSYTQFEFLYARRKGKKTWLIFAGDDCTRDTPRERLDLPANEAHFDPVAYQAERQALQETYQKERTKDGHVYYSANNDTDLELKVERLRDEFAEQRRMYSAWQSRVLRAIAAVFVLLVLIGGGVWWWGHQNQASLKELSSEARLVTRDKIRGQLRSAAEKTRDNALAEAKAASWQDRQRLREAVEQEHAVRISRIDELAASFAEMEATARSTPIFDEMTRTLAEKGVDQALAFVGTQRSRILEVVKPRVAEARKRNRDELQPLLKSAQLHAAKAQSVEAAALFRDVLVSEPDWPDALRAYFWFLIDQGTRAKAYDTLQVALRHFEKAEGIAQRIAAADPANSGWQRDLSISYQRLGELAKEQGKLGEAERQFSESLGIRKRLAAADPANSQWQRDLAVSLNQLGDAAKAQGKLGEAERQFTELHSIAQRLAVADPANSQGQRLLAISYERLGDLAKAQGKLGETERQFTESLGIRMRLAAADPANSQWQRDLAASYDHLGDLATAQDKLGEAERPFTESLIILKRLAAADPVNSQWQRDLSVSYGRLGDLATFQGKLGEAERRFTESLAIAQRLAAADPANSAGQRDLWLLYWRLAFLAEENRNTEAARDWWRKAHDTLLGMKQRGLFVSQEDEGSLIKLRAKMEKD